MNLLVSVALTASLLPADSIVWQMNDASWENPAFRQWMLPQSHSSIGINLHDESFSEPVDLQQGKGEHYWQAGAESFLRRPSSALWGDASYTNGKQLGVTWNESADIDLIYPYVTADSIGGDLNMERYRFAGGYAGSSGRQAWGVHASYEAGLYYRSVDPRPRNVTGQLDLAAGVGVKLWSDYYIGLSGGYRKYKQSCDIEFKNQTGVEKIFHLTGLGNLYHRFTGTGLSSYYDGHRLLGSINLLPSSGRGLSISASLSRFTFKKVLTELNKLPLVRAWHNEMHLQAAWTYPGHEYDYAVTADFSALRRHGHENLFGDATSSIYPQIGELDMYANNRRSASLIGLWQYHPASRRSILWIRAGGYYDYYSEVYSQPRSRMNVETAGLKATSRFVTAIGRRWTGMITGSYRISFPAKSSLHLASSGEDMPAGVSEIEAYRFTYVSKRSSAAGVGAEVRCRVNSSFMIALGGGWQRKLFARDTVFDAYTLALSIHF